jgi:hypothetical protein
MIFVLVVALVVALVGGLALLSFQYELTRSMWISFAQFAEHHDKSIVAIGTALLAIFTVVLAVATVFLWRATRNLVEDGKDSSERQLRAYVSLDGGIVVQANVNNGPGYLVRIELKNYGSSPGYDFTTWIMPPQILQVDAVPFGPSRPLSERTGQSIIGPHSSVWINWFAGMSPDELVAIRAREKGIFIWGGADYKDAFGHARKFIFRCLITGEQTEINGTAWALAPHKQGYEAD